jgi:hypothetical protein
MKWIETGNPAVAVYTREHDGDMMLIFNNLSPSAETVNLPAEYQKTYMDLFAGHTQTLTEKLALQPYSYLWLHTK